MQEEARTDLQQETQVEKLLDKDQIVTEVRTMVSRLQLPPDSYVVFGSGPLAVAGIRPAKDIDMLVSEAALAIMRQSGWKELHKGPSDVPLTDGIFEAHDNWNFSPYSPTLEHLLASAKVIDGVPFASLEEVKKWKTASSEAGHGDVQKNQRDIKAIDDYLTTHKE
jgi:hypothetical protein